MIFTQAEFFVFFAAVMAGLLAIRSNTPRKAFLLAASYYFYAWWDWRFCALLLYCTILNYAVGLGLGRTDQPGVRKLLVATSVVGSLIVLAAFKYYNFFVDSLNALLEPAGWRLGTLAVMLPVGISFFTFQSISYTIDVYRRELPPCRSFLNLALLTSLFPHLVAGPIVRGSQLLPQFEQYRPVTWDGVFSGFRLFVFGMVKKSLIADHVANASDVVFANPGIFDSATTWQGVIAYTIQIYCDFSGYTDMAIGLARMIGYEFCQNFNHPYLATSIDDFWRRWHVSLSSWLRDYLYIPLGGSRKGPARTYLNLILTMLLGGLWHGAAWTFVLWGLFQGLVLIAYRSAARLPAVAPWLAGGGLVHRVTSWLIMFHLTCYGWLIFRAQSLQQVRTLTAAVVSDFSLSSADLSLLTPLLLYVTPLLVVHACEAWFDNVLIVRRLPVGVRYSVYAATLYLIVLFGNFGGSDFIYFQF